MDEITMQGLLSRAAQRIGTLQMNEDLLQIQLAQAQADLAAVGLDREGLKSRYADLEVERNALAARLLELEPPPPPGPTTRTRPSRRGKTK